MKKIVARGMSLIEVCIGVALLGIATAAVFSMVRLVTGTLNAERVRSDAQALRRNLLEKVSCANTLNPTGAATLTVPPSGCASLQLKDSAKTTILASGDRFENLEVTYSCWSSTGGPNPDQIRVQYRSANLAQKNSYGDLRDLFQGIKPLCYSFFQGATVPAGAPVPVYLSCAARPTLLLSPPALPCSTTPIGYLAPL